MPWKTLARVRKPARSELAAQVERRQAFDREMKI
jgi:hypothetical protein